MVLVSSMIMILNNRRILENFKNIIENNSDKIIMDNMYVITYMTILLLVTTIPAVLVAINCNKLKPIRYGIIAFLFSDIYMLQWAIKKFIMKLPGYCIL